MKRDLTMWLAMHADCLPHGCGVCIEVEIELDDDLLEECKIHAKLLGITQDEYILRAIYALTDGSKNEPQVLPI